MKKTKHYKTFYDRPEYIKFEAKIPAGLHLELVKLVGGAVQYGMELVSPGIIKWGGEK